MYQKLIIIGNLGADPEMRYTQSGKAVANLRVAVGNYNNTQTTWFRVTVWEKLAEVVTQYVKKGHRVMCEGEIDASAWTDREGNARASLEMTAQTVKFLTPKNQQNNEVVEDGTAPWA